MSIKDYWIKEVQNIKEFKVISDLEDAELLNLKQEVANLIDDQFIETATEKGIARREKMLNIQPYSDDTLESRRFRTSVQWNNQGPYTQNQLINRLANLVGDDGYTIALSHESYTLTVKISLGVKRMLNDAEIMVTNMAPCNLIINVDLLYNRHIDLANFTHEYLGTKTHQQLREEVL